MINLRFPTRRHRASGLAVAIFLAPLLAACGSAETAGDAANAAKSLLSVDRLTEQLPPEAQTVVTAYERDVRAALSAHLAEFGQLPADLADIASVATARDAAVNLLADGLAEQIPFASRDTVEQAATGLVVAAERRILEQVSASDAQNP